MSGVAAERLAHAPAELLVLPPTHALVALALAVVAVRAGLDLRGQRAGRHRTLTIREVKDAPGKHLDLALPVSRLRVLV